MQCGELAKVSDYIAPPGVLSRESYPGLTEVTWSAGEYRTPAEITAAFGLPTPLPAARGRYLNEPNPYLPKWPAVRGAAALALIGLLFIQLYFVATRPRVTLLETDYSLPLAAGVEQVSTTPFVVAGHRQPVRVSVTAPLSNNWLDLDLELVNAAGGETRERPLSLSYYYGRDSDGDWTEGARSGTASFPAVEPGTYLLRLAPTTDPKSPALPIHVTVRAGGVFWANFLVALLLIVAYPGRVLLRRFGFEKERWAESDFLPYGLSRGNDDD